LADEVNQREDLPGSPSGGPASPEVEELGQSAVPEAGITGLEDLLAQRDMELTGASARLGELEQAVAIKDSEITELERAKDELAATLTALNSSLAETVASYKAMVIQANPEVIEELISGDTVAAINESLEKAKALVSRVRQGLESEISLARVPAGAPERALPDLSALSPREKIQYAIGGFSS
jgi:DNA repair exonuclease SbcCD ATPase subunit